MASLIFVIKMKNPCHLSLQNTEMYMQMGNGKNQHSDQSALFLGKHSDTVESIGAKPKTRKD